MRHFRFQPERYRLYESESIKDLRIYKKTRDLVCWRNLPPQSRAKGSAGARPLRKLEEIRTWQSQTTDAVSRIPHEGLPVLCRDKGRGQLPQAAGYWKLPQYPGASRLELPAHRSCPGEGLRPPRVRRGGISILWSPFLPAWKPLTPLNNEIKRCILSEDEVADEASPGLSKVAPLHEKYCRPDSLPDERPVKLQPLLSPGRSDHHAGRPLLPCR